MKKLIILLILIMIAVPAIAQTEDEIDAYLGRFTKAELYEIVNEWVIMKNAEPVIIMPETLYLLERGNLHIYRENPIININIGWGLLEYDIHIQQEVIIKGFYNHNQTIGIRVVYFCAGFFVGGVVSWLVK